MGEIVLTKGKVALVDDADVEWLSQWKWRTGGSNAAYAIRTGPRPRQEVIYMHRLILGLVSGDGMEGDHRNGDKLDNRRSNLRVATHQQNQHNYPSLHGASRYRGVTLHKGRWRAGAHLHGRHVHIGMFGSEEEARDAAVAMAGGAHAVRRPRSAWWPTEPPDTLRAGNQSLLPQHLRPRAILGAAVRFPGEADRATQYEYRRSRRRMEERVQDHGERPQRELCEPAEGSKHGPRTGCIAHCPACSTCFTSQSAFDTHRVGPMARSGPSTRYCDPDVADKHGPLLVIKTEHGTCALQQPPRDDVTVWAVRDWWKAAQAFRGKAAA